MKNKTNSLREEFEKLAETYTGQGGFHLGCYECDYGMDKNELWNWFQSKLTQILEGLPCEEKKYHWSDDGFDPDVPYRKHLQEVENSYNQHVKETKQYRDKILKELK